MPIFKFSHDYRDKELDRVVKADEEVEMLVKRANEIVNTVRGVKGYENFEATRIEDDKDE